MGAMAVVMWRMMIQHRWRCPKCISEIRSDDPIEVRTSRRSVKHNSIADYLHVNEGYNIDKVVENYILCVSCGYRHWLLDSSIGRWDGDVDLRYLD